MVWTGAAPTIQAFRIPPTGLVLGRELLDNTTDDRISRQHARVAWRDNRFIVTDLGSRNGTYAGGNPLVDREVTVMAPSIVRTGRTVSVLLEDIRRFEAASIATRHDALVGPSTAPQWNAVEQAARAGDNLLILGEPGTGKGRMARGYLRMRGRQEAVFNPTIQAVPLERVVGPQVETLLLEQVGKLGAQNLATLVKLLERPNLRVVTTAAAPLEQLGLEQELAWTLSTRTVAVPPLRDRPDEMAFLVNDAVRAAEPALQIHSTLVEACLLRPWPGNVRELLVEIRSAASAVVGESRRVEARHLPATAGTVFGSAMPETRRAPSVPPDSVSPEGYAAHADAAHAEAPRDAKCSDTADEPRKRMPRDGVEWRQRIEEALRANAGNVAATARALGLHRTQLRRLVERYGIAIAGAASREDDDTE